MKQRKSAKAQGSGQLSVKESNQSPEPISSLSAIAELCAEPVVIEFVLRGKACKVEARLLKPFETEILKLQLDEVTFPPFLKGKTPDEDRYEAHNVEYLQRRTKREREVRAQALFWTGKVFQESKPELVEGMYRPDVRRLIVEHVQGLLTESILEAAYARISEPAISVAEQVNLT